MGGYRIGRFGPIPEDIRGALGLKPQTPDLKHKSPQVVLWGTGNPRREFLHVDDLADACVFLMNLDETTFSQVTMGAVPSASTLKRSAPQAQRSSANPFPLINIGYGEDSTIRDLASLVARVVGYEGEVVWDTTKPDGMARKLVDVSRLKSLGWSPGIGLETGVSPTYNWYVKQLR